MSYRKVYWFTKNAFSLPIKT
ncbi:unnamed protein product [Macrosiphum euphorbiae]|uniref:Uncharacterized protein n=1 Tax=Macrosiphum euphorbiae TaxID=13131 RepID=A0AAV0WK28_9HEMI|nr:unnamed protein product [Macrosiphum euphorbiae]